MGLSQKLYGAGHGSYAQNGTGHPGPHDNQRQSPSAPPTDPYATGSRAPTTHAYTMPQHADPSQPLAPFSGDPSGTMRPYNTASQHAYPSQAPTPFSGDPSGTMRPYGQTYGQNSGTYPYQGNPVPVPVPPYGQMSQTYQAPSPQNMGSSADTSQTLSPSQKRVVSSLGQLGLNEGKASNLVGGAGNLAARLARRTGLKGLRRRLSGGTPTNPPYQQSAASNSRTSIGSSRSNRGLPA